ncbi:hypothetical protein M8C21_009445 [Ambrosia artemisiifolia]|uniref:Uncharacterized protein n=1 Tax=Ambrosia artemisiifolia TaxID=4212 RepID=A0AAD5G5Y0_AMBAR|nr:hypothetical protein M8C21_009445 [Ambrosia artemisiifolia]
MEQNLFSNFTQTLTTQPKPSPSLKPFSIARTLITNPSTTNQTISSIIHTLTSSNLNNNINLLHVTSLLSLISSLYPHLSPIITTSLLSLLTRPSLPPRAVTNSPNTHVSSPPTTNSDLGIADMTEKCLDALSRAAELAVSAPFSSNSDVGVSEMTEESLAVTSRAVEATPRAAAIALSTLVSLRLDTKSDVGAAETTEGVFLGLCFGSSVSVRQRMLMDAKRYDVRPSILLTVFLGFTKDPYPYVRKAALDGLIGLCDRVVVEDRCMIEGCYVRGVELLGDVEECVRCSAVRMVSEWGKLLVENSDDKGKRDLSDALYVQVSVSYVICFMNS